MEEPRQRRSRWRQLPTVEMVAPPEQLDVGRQLVGEFVLRRFDAAAELCDGCAGAFRVTSGARPRLSRISAAFVSRQPSQLRAMLSGNKKPSIMATIKHHASPAHANQRVPPRRAHSCSSITVLTL